LGEAGRADDRRLPTWGRRLGVVTVAVVTFLLPHAFPDARPIRILFDWPSILLTWLVLGGLLASWRLLSVRLRRSYPTSPPVSTSAYVVLTLLILPWLGIIAVDEYYRMTQIPDAPFLHFFLAVFGGKRHLLTWPAFFFALFWLGRYLLRKLEQRQHH
jgi:hypothetical protein